MPQFCVIVFLTVVCLLAVPLLCRAHAYSVQFHPAPRSYYSGSGLYERKWMSCVQELQELKQQYNNEYGQQKKYASSATYKHKTEIHPAEQIDSDEINYPPNYVPAYQYEKLHISDVIYPLKLHQTHHLYHVPDYSAHKNAASGPVRKPAYSQYGENGQMKKNPYKQQKYGGKMMPEYGQHHQQQEKPVEQQHPAAEYVPGSKVEKVPLEYNPKEYKPIPLPSTTTSMEEEQQKGYEKQQPVLGEKSNSAPTSSENYAGQEEQNENEELTGYDQKAKGEEDKAAEYHSKEANANGVDSTLKNFNQSDEPYGSEQEHEEGFGKPWDDEGEEDGGYSNEGVNGEEVENEEEYSKEENHPEGEQQEQVAQPSDILPPPPSVNGEQQQQEDQFTAQQPGEIIPDGMEQQQQQQPQAQQAAGEGGQQVQQQQQEQQQQNPAQQPTPNSNSTNNNGSCRLEPLELCSIRASCADTRLDCSLQGDDLIFDVATQGCRSIFDVPECEKEQYCTGKTFGWTLVGGQCAKVAYLCGVPSASDQQQQPSDTNKVFCNGTTVVNPQTREQCVDRTTVAGC